MSFPRKRKSSFHAVFMDSSLRWNDRLLYNFFIFKLYAIFIPTLNTEEPKKLEDKKTHFFKNL